MDIVYGDIPGAFVEDDGSVIYYPDLGSQDLDFDKTAESDLYDAASNLARASRQLAEAKTRLEEYLDGLPEYKELLEKKEAAARDHQIARRAVQEYAQRVVRHKPELSTAAMKSAFVGITYKKSRDIAYSGGVNAIKGKGILHDWLVKYGVINEGVFCLNINGALVPAPVVPVKKVTPTIPAIYSSGKKTSTSEDS